MGKRLAINLFDLDRLHSHLRSKIAGMLKVAPIDVSYDRKNSTECALEFSCDLLAAAMLCDVLRSHDREAGDSPIRLYLRKSEAWTRVPEGAVLTMKIAGRYQLNPAIFSGEAEPPTPVPLTRLHGRTRRVS